eukprot:TRINITY_DN5403_c0_g1_i2.p1 TRINITY_DN5403_c0_g1~~TRINITY_DN5403_c0_g1_i2.p1  ORF type:complete len:357 (-),score=117.68 TRINITY_DN5403_c0_g1_i2:118-1188(-)
MIRRPPRSTLSSSSAASDVYKRQEYGEWPVASHAVSEVPVMASNNHQLVLRALERIYDDCGKDHSILNRMNDTQKKLRKTCVSAMNVLKADPTTDPESCAAPLLEALNSKLSGSITISIDCLSKLMAYGFLKMPLDDMQAAGGGKTLMDVVVEAVCKCSHETDDSVQLQVLQALLTAVTSDKCEVHDTQLQLTVRTCCHIHLTTKSATNQAIARAALSQMLTSVFDRMERHFEERAEARAEEDGAPAEAHTLTEPERDEPADPKQNGSCSANGSSPAEAESEPDSETEPVPDNEVLSPASPQESEDVLDDALAEDPVMEETRDRATSLTEETLTKELSGVGGKTCLLYTSPSPRDS